MFLQKQRLNKEPHRNSSLQGNKLEEILKRISIPEIKSHKKSNPYLNPRDLLIHTTERLFKQSTKLVNRQQRNNKSELSNANQPSFTRNSFMNHHSDLSTRESRVLAARRYRQRIGKRNDITPYLRAQEQLALSRRSQVMRFSHNESSDRVQRYRDMLKELADEGSDDKKELIKNYWLTGAGKNMQKKTNSNKNPQLPITNIEFDELLDQNANSRVLINRERRTSLRRNNYTSYSSHGRRPNRANPKPFQDDNFIEPW